MDSSAPAAQGVFVFTYFQPPGWIWRTPEKRSTLIRSDRLVEINARPDVQTAAAGLYPPPSGGFINASEYKPASGWGCSPAFVSSLVPSHQPLLLGDPVLTSEGTVTAVCCSVSPPQNVYFYETPQNTNVFLPLTAE